MQTLRSKDEAWQRCPPGTLVKAARRQKSRRRNRHIAELAVGGVLAIVIGFVVLPQVFPPPQGMRENRFGGIACSEVQRLMPDFSMQRVPQEIADQIRQHLAECPMCRERMEKMQQMQGNVSHSASHGAIAISAHLQEDWVRELSWFGPTPSHIPLELHLHISAVD